MILKKSWGQGGRAPGPPDPLVIFRPDLKTHFLILNLSKAIWKNPCSLSSALNQRTCVDLCCFSNFAFLSRPGALVCPLVNPTPIPMPNMQSLNLQGLDTWTTLCFQWNWKQQTAFPQTSIAIVCSSLQLFINTRTHRVQLRQFSQFKELTVCKQRFQWDNIEQCFNFWAEWYHIISSCRSGGTNSGRTTYLQKAFIFAEKERCDNLKEFSFLSSCFCLFFILNWIKESNFESASNLTFNDTCMNQSRVCPPSTVIPPRHKKCRFCWI